MVSGRKDRVVISCVTFEVAKIVEPIEYYEATRVHLLSTSKEGDIYREFLDEVCKQIGDYSKKTQIIKHITQEDENGEQDFNVSDFGSVMRELLCIIQGEIDSCGENNVEIFVNISAGTSEYSAASLIASMMFHGQTIPFTVSSKEYSVSGDLVRKVYFENGVPVGQTKSCRQPKALSTYRIDRPEKDKVLALAVMKEQIEKGDSCAASMMNILREKNLFDDYSTREYNNKPEQRDIMKYQRNYVDFWLDNRWVEKQSKRKYRITELGEEVLSIFEKSYSQKND